MNQKEKILILLRGIPGSGKSSLAKELVRENGIICSTDDFFIDKETGEYKFDKNLLDRNHKANIDKVIRAMEQNISPIIVDNTNLTREDMYPYVKAAKDHGYRVEFKYPKTPWAFNVEELEKRNIHGVNSGTIKKMLNKFYFTDKNDLEFADEILKIREKNG